MKNVMKTLAFSGLMLLGFFVLAPAVKADAAVKQTAIAKDSVTVAWDAQANATNYKVYVGTESGNAKLKATLTPSATSYKITGLKAGKAYYVQVKYDYKSYSGSVYEYTAGSMYDAKTLPAQVTGLKEAQWWYYLKEFQAEWNKQTGADGYQYRVFDNKGKKKASGKTTSGSTTYFNVYKISNSVVYSAQVRSFVKVNGKTYYGKWSAKSYFFTQPQMKKAQISGNKLKLTWGKVAGATGYDVYVSTKSQSGYKKVKSLGKKTSVVIPKFNKKKFSPKKRYYAYIISRKKVGKKTYKSARQYYWTIN